MLIIIIDYNIVKSITSKEDVMMALYVITIASVALALVTCYQVRMISKQYRTRERKLSPTDVVLISLNITAIVVIIWVQVGLLCTFAVSAIHSTIGSLLWNQAGGICAVAITFILGAIALLRYESA